MSMLLTELISEAIKENDLEALEALNYCSALDQPDADGNLPLVQCINHDRREAFLQLLEIGASLKPKGGGLHPLAALAKAGKLEWIMASIETWRGQARHLEVMVNRNQMPVSVRPISLSERY